MTPPRSMQAACTTIVHRPTVTIITSGFLSWLYTGQLEDHLKHFFPDSFITNTGLGLYIAIGALPEGFDLHFSTIIIM